MPISSSLILHQAAKLVDGDRDNQHGNKHDNFRNIATMWNAYINTMKHPLKLQSKDVAKMMVLLKLARTQTGNFNEDDYVDMAGYTGCAAELEDHEL